LFSIVHEIIREMLKAIEQGAPGVILGEEDDDALEFLDIHIGPVKTAVLWESHSLASAIDEQPSSFHDESPFLPEVDTMIYTTGSIPRQGLSVMTEGSVEQLHGHRSRRNLGPVEEAPEPTGASGHA